MKKLLSLLLMFAIPALAEFKVPELKNPVNDYANVLTKSGKERIATELVRLKQETGAQLGVLIVNTTDGDSIEEASMKAARQWKLGSKDKDDGALLLIAVKDRKLRLEVGYGLEGIVTDFYAKRITGGMKNSLKAQNYDGAVLAAVDGLSSRIKQYKDDITSKNNKPTEGGLGSFILMLILGVLGLSGIIAFFTYRRMEKDKEAEREAAREARRIASRLLTWEERVLADKLNEDFKNEAKRNPIPPPKKEEKSKRNLASDDDDSPFVTGLVVGSILSNSGRSSGSGYSSGGSDDSSSSSSSSSDFGGGGGDFGGGGSSDSW